MGIRTSEDGPDLPQSYEHVMGRQVGVQEADLPKLSAPAWGKVEAKCEPPIKCFIRDPRGGLHRAEIVGMECDSGQGPPASFVCLSCRNAFDDAAQGGIQAVAVKCPRCKKKGVEIVPANRQGAIYPTKGGPGGMVYLVCPLETQAEMMVDDPDSPGKKMQQMVTIRIKPEDRIVGTLTADRIQLE